MGKLYPPEIETAPAALRENDPDDNLRQDQSSAAHGPIPGLAETCSQCLALSRDYAEKTITDDPEQEVDLDALEHFISARADLLAAAEANISDLTGQPEIAGQPDSTRREMTSKVVAILEEMAEMESQLNLFLNDRLARMRQTIGQMKKAQPVFKRYGYLGGPRAPSRITRHE